jgi:heme exporter protein C
MGKRFATPMFFALWSVTLAACLAAVAQIFERTPEEAQMGIVQKIFYFHVPSAYCMYLGATACFVGSVGYFLSPRDLWDAIARAGAGTAIIFGLVVMTTGPLWAAKAWGRLWVWDTRLTTSLLSLLIYVAYGVLRSFAGDTGAEKRFAAALGVVGAANLPVIHFAVQKWGGQHPQVISGNGGGLSHPQMRVALAVAFVAFTLLWSLLMWLRVRSDLIGRRMERLTLDALDLGADVEVES